MRFRRRIFYDEICPFSRDTRVKNDDLRQFFKRRVFGLLPRVLCGRSLQFRRVPHRFERKGASKISVLVAVAPHDESPSHAPRWNFGNCKLTLTTGLGRRKNCPLQNQNKSPATDRHSRVSPNGQMKKIGPYKTKTEPFVLARHLSLFTRHCFLAVPLRTASSSSALSCFTSSFARPSAFSPSADC